MSALGQKQTLKSFHLMSALPPNADIVQHDGNVRFVPKADIMRRRKTPPIRSPRWQSKADRVKFSY
jgi:hypothetical protein